MLVKLMKYAKEHIPYYRELFLENDIDVEKEDDFYRIPILNKTEIQARFQDMISDEYNIDDLVMQKTSGSSGIPLKCYYDQKEKFRRGVALWNHRKENCSSIFGKNMVSFHTGGRKITSDEIQREDNVLYLDYIGKTGLNDEKLLRFYHAIREFEPFFIRSLPSVLHRFINFCNSNCLDLICLHVQYIELVGEYLTQNIYEDIKNAFPEARVHNFYGSQEFYTIAYSCSENRLHIDNSVFVEIMNPDEEGYGKIVVTGLKNYCMPFIRYNIGDMGRISEETCKCGKKEKVIELKSSRQSEYFKIDDKVFSGDTFKLIIDKFSAEVDSTYVCQFQIIQTENKKFTIHLKTQEKNAELKQKFHDFMLMHLTQKYGLHVELQVDERSILSLNEKTNKFKMYNFIKYD